MRVPPPKSPCNQRLSLPGDQQPESSLSTSSSEAKPPPLPPCTRTQSSVSAASQPSRRLLNEAIQRQPQAQQTVAQAATKKAHNLFAATAIPNNFHLATPTFTRNPDNAIDLWATQSEINANNLLTVNHKKTRYGVINLAGSNFIIGPRPDDKFNEIHPHIYQKLIDQYPQIGKIYSVDPDLDAHRSSQPSHCPGGYVKIGSYKEQGGEAEKPREVEYYEFRGIKQGLPNAEAYWKAGQDVAQFIRDNPEKVPMICSEGGLSRPCAVAVSAAMQLKENALVQIGEADFAQELNKLSDSVREQRSLQSAHDLHPAVFSGLFETSKLLNSIRTPGTWANQAGDLVPPALPATLLGNRGLVIQHPDGHIMHRYSYEAKIGDNAPALTEHHDQEAKKYARPDDIYLFYIGNEEHAPHYEVGNAYGQAWNGQDEVTLDGDCLFRALHRALPEDLRQGETEQGAIQIYRNSVADYLANNIDRLTPFLVHQESTIDQKPQWVSQTLGEITQHEQIQQKALSYTELHTDPISADIIDPNRPSTIRLVTHDKSGTKNTDNKYYDKACIAQWYKTQVIRDEMNTCTSPTNRLPVIGFIDHQGSVHDIELLLGSAQYTMSVKGQKGKSNTYELPNLSMQNRRIAFITDKDGRIIGGPAEGEPQYIRQQLARNAVFFLPRTSAITEHQESLVCRYDTNTNKMLIGYTPKTHTHNQYKSLDNPYTIWQLSNGIKTPFVQHLPSDKGSLLSHMVQHALDSQQHVSIVEPRIRLAHRHAPLVGTLRNEGAETRTISEDRIQESTHESSRLASAPHSLVQRLRNVVPKRRVVTQPQTCATEAQTRPSSRREDDPDADQGPSTSGSRRTSIFNTLRQAAQKVTGKTGDYTLVDSQQNRQAQSLSLAPIPSFEELAARRRLVQTHDEHNVSQTLVNQNQKVREQSLQQQAAQLREEIAQLEKQQTERVHAKVKVHSATPPQAEQANKIPKSNRERTLLAS